MDSTAGKPKTWSLFHCRACRRTQESYARLLRPHSRMGGHFLEIGPDIGLFASSFAKSGSFHHFWLYEPNRDVHQSLAGNFRGLSFTINSGIFHASDMPAQSVSTAVMIHVLDHLLQPKEFLHEVRASLEPGGVILNVTHDCASGLARLLGRRWPPYTLQHQQLFSRRSLAALLQASGFDVVESVKTTNYFPVAFLMRAALTVFGLPERLIPAAESPLLGLKLGNIGTIARKVPCQQEHVVGPAFEQRLGRQNRQVIAGREAALLEMAAVNHEID